MKYLIILGLFVNLGFSQSMSSGVEYVHLFNVVNTNSAGSYVNEDLNYDGTKEILKGGKIIRTGENEYWVQNTSLTTKNGEEITFNKTIYKNETPLINQAISENGYILIFNSGLNEVIVYFADKHGSKDSDPISIPLE